MTHINAPLTEIFQFSATLSVLMEVMHQTLASKRQGTAMQQWVNSISAVLSRAHAGHHELQQGNCKMEKSWHPLH
jgi:hypothetical protein